MQRMMQQQEFDAALTGVVDSRGNPTTFDGIPVWESSDPAMVDLRVAEDGMSAVVGSLDADGSVNITVTGDARQGDEVVPVIAVLSVIVAPGDVAVFGIDVSGEVRDRTQAEPEQPA